MKRALLLLCLLTLAACAQNNGQQGPELAGSQFIGGTTGIVPEFLPGSPPDVVYDGGNFPFDVVVALNNKGEFHVPAENARVEISGIRGEEFGVSQASLVNHPDQDVLGRQLDSSGNVLETSPSYVEFSGLNHQQPIVGSSQTFPIQASVCYLYGTVASTQLCSRENLLNPRPGGICAINEDKTVSNSGAPVQVSSVRENTRAHDRVGFTFKVVHSGQGVIYKDGSGCDQNDRRLENQVGVRVTTGLPGLACSGLDSGNQGTITLFGGEKTVTCTQEIPTPADFEFPVTVELIYDYEERVTTQVQVKHQDVGPQI